MNHCRVCKQLIAEPNDVCRACFTRLPVVRVCSAVGPCLTGYRLLRWNAATATLVFENGGSVVCERERRGAVHLDACPGCQDHPHSHYREGYLD